MITVTCQNCSVEVTNSRAYFKGRDWECLHCRGRILEKYSDSAELVVCIHLNRRFSFDPIAIRLPRVRLGGIYFVASATPDRSYWHLAGDLLNEPAVKTVFAHP